MRGECVLLGRGAFCPNITLNGLWCVGVGRCLPFSGEPGFATRRTLRMMKPIAALLVIAAATSTPTASAFLPFGQRGSTTTTPAPSLFGGTPSLASSFLGAGGSLIGGLLDTLGGSAEEEVQEEDSASFQIFIPTPFPPSSASEGIGDLKPDFDPATILPSPPDITQPPETDAAPVEEANLPPASPFPTQRPRIFAGLGVPLDPSALAESVVTQAAPTEARSSASADDSSRPDSVCKDDRASGVVEALSQAGASVFAAALNQSTIASCESGIQTLLAPSDECARDASLSDCEWITRRIEGVEAANATEVNGVSEMSRRLDGAELTFTTRFWCKDQDNHGVVHVFNYA